MALVRPHKRATARKALPVHPGETGALALQASI